MKTYDVRMNQSKDHVFWKQRQCPKLGPLPPAKLTRRRPPRVRRWDKIEKRKKYSRSNTLDVANVSSLGIMQGFIERPIS